jgi:hypothetical protein
MYAWDDRWKILTDYTWSGDILILGIVTLYGFATHGELAEAGMKRMLTTFLPLLLHGCWVAWPSKIMTLTYTSLI